MLFDLSTMYITLALWVYLKYALLRSLSGFVLIEVAFAILVVGIVGTLGISGYRVLHESQAYRVTENRMERIFTALAHYAARNGVLPCPTAPELDGVAPNQGVMGCPHIGGEVPYATLGLSVREIQDGWHRSIRYVIDPSLHPSCLDIQAYAHILGAFCDAKPGTIAIRHRADAQPSAVHPAVVLWSYGRCRRPERTHKPQQEVCTDCEWVEDAAALSGSILRFVTRDHLLAFYGQSGCPVSRNIQANAPHV